MNLRLWSWLRLRLLYGTVRGYYFTVRLCTLDITLTSALGTADAGRETRARTESVECVPVVRVGVVCCPALTLKS